MILARELSGRTYGHIGIPGQHHLISHHREDPAQMAEKARIDTNHVPDAGVLPGEDGRDEGRERLAAGQQPDHVRLGVGNGNLHRHSDLPILLAGKMGGKVKQGRTTLTKMDTPMANLLVTILDKAGVPIETLGDSTGRLTPDPLTIG